MLYYTIIYLNVSKTLEKVAEQGFIKKDSPKMAK